MVPAKFYEALEVVVFIALDNSAEPVSSKRICESQGVLPRHLEPVMQQLVRTKILKGTKGPKGGYRLAREKRRITVGDVYRIFSHGLPASGSAVQQQILKPLATELEGLLLQKLDAMTLDELCHNDRHPPEDKSEAAHFTI